MSRKSPATADRLRLAIILLPPLRADAVGPQCMPFLSRLASEGRFVPFQPEPLDLAKQRLLAPINAPDHHLAYRLRGNRASRRLVADKIADMVPRRAFFRPLRRWIARRWQGFSLSCDPAFTPSASVAWIEPVPVLDPEDNLLFDLEEAGLSSACSLLDYPWLPQHVRDYTWLDRAHQRDYMAWAFAAVRSRTDIVCVEMGHRVGRALSGKSFYSPTNVRHHRRLDRLLERVLALRAERRSRQFLILCPETLQTVRNRIDLEKVLETEHFLPGIHYCAAILPTYAQIWSIDVQSRPHLERCISQLSGVTLTSPREILASPAGEGDREYGDFVALAEFQSIFHPNHVDGKTHRLAAAGWAASMVGENRGFAVLHGNQWAFPAEGPELVDVSILRAILLRTLGWT